MKNILILAISLLIASCTQKYTTYSVIDKTDFKLGSEHNPTTPKMYSNSKDQQYQCVGQWFFMNNAQTQVENSISHLLSHTCKKSQYLLDAKVTNRWWTTIIYTRACIMIEASCPAK